MPQMCGLGHQLVFLNLKKFIHCYNKRWQIKIQYLSQTSTELDSHCSTWILVQFEKCSMLHSAQSVIVIVRTVSFLSYTRSLLFSGPWILQFALHLTLRLSQHRWTRFCCLLHASLAYNLQLLQTRILPPGIPYLGTGESNCFWEVIRRDLLLPFCN